MTISKDILLNRYAEHLSDAFPKRKVRDTVFSGYVFADNVIANQFHKTIDVLSMILGRIFSSDIDFRSLQFIGHLIEKVCKESDATFLPWQKASSSYQQFLQTLGSVEPFSLKFFPPFNVETMRLLASEEVFVKEVHLPIGVKVTLTQGQSSSQFKALSWKVSFKRLMDKNDLEIQPYLRRKLLSCGYIQGGGNESMFSFFCWDLYKRTLACIKEILIKEGVDFFFLQGVSEDFHSFLKETISEGDLQKIYDICFFKKGVCSQVLIYKKHQKDQKSLMGWSKLEDKSEVKFPPLCAYSQISQMQTDFGPWFFFNIDIDDANYELTAKKTIDITEKVTAILKENRGGSVFFLIAGAVKTAEAIEEFFLENQKVKIFRLKSASFTELQILQTEEEIKKSFGSFSEFIVLQATEDLHPLITPVVESIDMGKIIECIQERKLGFPSASSEKTLPLINI